MRMCQLILHFLQQTLFSFEKQKIRLDRDPIGRILMKEQMFTMQYEKFQAEENS